MPLVLFHTPRVREALKASGSWGIELLVLGIAASLIGALVMVGRQVSAPYHEHVEISLSFWVLPGYTLLSLCRGLAAYVLSLVFTLVYGTIAAHNARAEKIMIPTLDVLQALPVLSFLPGLVLAMVALFPTRQIGLELACVIMIFTGQAWNMTFSFHGSLRGIPQPLREVARLQHLSWWKTFRLLEVPAAMIGLVWNSMMSMAGGWFFLTVNEAFTLQGKDFRLPGIGSYMQQAIDDGNVPAMLAAIVAMTAMIVLVDQVLWRPIVVWSQRFKLEEQAEAHPPTSWMLDLLNRSRLFHAVMSAIYKWKRPAGNGAVAKKGPPPSSSGAASIMSIFVRALFLVALAIVALWGAWALVKMLLELPINAHGTNDDWLGVLLALLASFGRTSAAVIIGAAWTLPVGILIGLSAKWSERLQPVIQVVASFPAPMLFPLVTIAVLFFHIPFTIGCVALMLLGAQWYILFNVIAGASAIPSELREVGRVYRMGRWRMWTRLYLPAVFPYLLTGLVTAAGGAWNATIVSEYVVLKKTHIYQAYGLGSLIYRATDKGNFPLLAAGATTMAVAVVLINRFFWKRLYRLAEERYSLNV